MDLVDVITSDDKPLAYFVSHDAKAQETSFLTPDHLPLQLGFVVYPKGGEIPRHRHRPLERRIEGTNEFLLVRSGRCEIDIYDENNTVVATRELGQGDVVLLVGGGHGLRMLEDCVLLEVKQGPYMGIDEKERF